MGIPKSSAASAPESRVEALAAALATAREQQAAINEILQVISASPTDIQPVLDTVAKRAAYLCDAPDASDLIREGDVLRVMSCHARDGATPVPTGYVVAVEGSMINGRTVLDACTVHHADIVPLLDGEFRAAKDNALRFGFRAVLSVPLMRESVAYGALFVWRPVRGLLSPDQIALLETFARQAAIAIQNARMVEEIRRKGRELEVASQHKSEFLANMSHELRTPLNAIIGFSEVLLERMFGELNEKQDDYLKDIHVSGRHLLSLINDILDLSKVEAGRMELEPSTFDAPTAIDNAMTLVRERAQRHGIALVADLAPGVADVTADERKFKQILLNLLTDAVKFTPDGGRIVVAARRIDGALEVAVRDTGIGIAKEDQAAVFEEFRQVGRHYTNRREGTGLGLALTRRFVELHGGAIVLESEPGKGSTFTFTIPDPPRAAVSAAP